LIVVEKPDSKTDRDANVVWISFQRPLQGLEDRYKNMKTLAENVFLIPLQSDLPALGEILDSANDARIKYQILFFEKAPDWVYSQPPPETTPKQ
jgi:hypothetical protein